MSADVTLFLAPLTLTTSGASENSPELQVEGSMRSSETRVSLRDSHHRPQRRNAVAG